MDEPSGHVWKDEGILMVRHSGFVREVDPRFVRWIDTLHWCDEVVPNKRHFENLWQNVGAKLFQLEMVTLVRMHHRKCR